MPGPCSGKKFDINFGIRLCIFKREEARLSSSLLNIICYQIRDQILTTTWIGHYLGLLIILIFVSAAGLPIFRQNLPNFLCLHWKLYNRYYHNIHYLGTYLHKTLINQRHVRYGINIYLLYENMLFFCHRNLDPHAILFMKVF